MEKKEFITISVSEYEELCNLRADKEFEEEEAYKAQMEEYRNTLAKRMFDLCVENDTPHEVVNSIINDAQDAITDAFGDSNPLEIKEALLDFMDYEYNDSVTGETRTLNEWIQFFHDPETYDVEALYNRCKELYEQKNEILKQLRALVAE